jgi:hypothetical protein
VLPKSAKSAAKNKSIIIQKAAKNTTSITSKKELKNYFVPFKPIPIFTSKLITTPLHHYLHHQYKFHNICPHAATDCANQCWQLPTQQGLH